MLSLLPRIVAIAELVLSSEGGPSVRGGRQGAQGRRGVQAQLQPALLVPERPVRMLDALPAGAPIAVDVTLS